MAVQHGQLWEQLRFLIVVPKTHCFLHDKESWCPLYAVHATQILQECKTRITSLDPEDMFVMHNSRKRGGAATTVKKRGDTSRDRNKPVKLKSTRGQNDSRERGAAEKRKSIDPRDLPKPPKRNKNRREVVSDASSLSR